MAQSDFWNKLKKRLREVSTAAADFTEEQALIGKLKFDILTFRRKIDHKNREIGVKVCDLSQEKTKLDILQDGDIVRLITEIGEIEKQVAGKRQDITKVADQVRSRRNESRQQASDDKPSEGPKVASDSIQKTAPEAKPEPMKKAHKKSTVSKKKSAATKEKATVRKSKKSTEKKKKKEEAD